jgi:hypothetical protein
LVGTTGRRNTRISGTEVVIIACYRGSRASLYLVATGYVAFISWTSDGGVGATRDRVTCVIRASIIIVTRDGSVCAPSGVDAGVGSAHVVVVAKNGGVSASNIGGHKNGTCTRETIVIGELT